MNRYSISHRPTKPAKGQVWQHRMDKYKDEPVNLKVLHVSSSIVEYAYINAGLNRGSCPPDVFIGQHVCISGHE